MKTIITENQSDKLQSIFEKFIKQQYPEAFDLESYLLKKQISSYESLAYGYKYVHNGKNYFKWLGDNPDDLENKYYWNQFFPQLELTGTFGEALIDMFGAATTKQCFAKFFEKYYGLPVKQVFY